MQSHKTLYVDTSYMKPQPRDEMMRIPGSQSSQARTKHNVNVIPRRPPPCSRVVSDGSQTNRIPRTLNFQSRTPSHGTRHETTHSAYTTQKPSKDGPYSDLDSQSFGILDFYTQETSPTTSANATSKARPVTQTDQARIAAFDFGLDAKQSHSETKPRRPVLGVTTQFESSKPSENISPGTSRPQKPGRPSPPSSTRRPSLQPLSTPLPSTPTELNYTLFPKEPLTPTILRNDTEPSIPTSLNTTASLPPLDTALPTRPRKASLASIRSRSDSLATLLPALSFSPQRRKASTSTQHTSLTSSPPSRWSGDTVTSEGRYSGAEDAQSPQWPQSFFEDDDDEGVPLRRKVVERFRRVGVRETSGEWGNGNAWGKERKWKLAGCGCLGKRK